VNVLSDSTRLTPEQANQVEALELRWAARREPVPAQLRAPDLGTALDCDVLLAGGGLSLLYAVVLAERGFRVAVADPRGVGRGHREWNASLSELRALEPALGTCELDDLVVARYQRGIIRWHGKPTRTVTGVLDVAVDAQGLLDKLRARALGLGVKLVDDAGVGAVASGDHGVVAQVGKVELTARLLLDGRGAASPHARWDLVCPTVGGVLTGLAQGSAEDEVDPGTGEILVTVEGAHDGLQPIWEGFPGRPGEFTAYLFEYTEPSRLGPRPLTELFQRFFATLPRYKRGEAQLLRPAFGFIPAYTRLRPRPTAPADRVLLVGDAAGRHSPLTFCGFGCALRSYGPVSARLAELLEQDQLGRSALATAWRRESGSLSIQGALALMMIERGGLRTAEDPQAINALLDAAFGALEAQGDEAFRSFLQDRATPGQVWRMLRDTARALPQVYGLALRNLSSRELLAFGYRLAAFSLGASA